MQYKIAKYKPESTIRHQGWTVGGLETNLPRSRVDYLFLFICFYSAILHERACLHSIEKTLKLSKKTSKIFLGYSYRFTPEMSRIPFFYLFFPRILHYAMPWRYNSLQHEKDKLSLGNLNPALKCRFVLICRVARHKPVEIKSSFYYILTHCELFKKVSPPTD